LPGAKKIPASPSARRRRAGDKNRCQPFAAAL
jgi:hypothetical protein